MFDQIEKRETKMLISESLAYKGKGSELALVMCKNFALTVLTFGFYMAWARTNTRRYIWNNVSFLDDRAAYLGTGKELFRGWAIVGSLYIGVALVFGVFNRMVPLNVQMITSILLIPFYVYLYSLIIYGGSRYRLACTKWREVRFGMKRNHKLAKDFFWLNLKGTFFTVLTLGIYLPFYQNKKRAFLVNNSHLGTGKFYYGGDAKEYALLFLKGVFFSIMTLGIYLPWMILSLKRFAVENISFNNSVFFKFRLKGSEFLIFALVSYFGTLLTLGLALPWIVNWGYRLFINSVEVFGEVDFSVIENTESSGSAEAEMASVLFDVDLGF